MNAKVPNTSTCLEGIPLDALSWPSMLRVAKPLGNLGMLEGNAELGVEWKGSVPKVVPFGHDYL